MIAKIPPRRRDNQSSFRDLTNYILGITGHDENSILHVGIQNLYSAISAPIEMEVLASENTRCRDPVFHFILSWRELERPTAEQADEAVKIALTELDLQDCQALWALQSDTENLHVHVAVNRIDPETGRAIQPAGNWTKKALEKAARKIELAQGWAVEQSGRYAVTPEGEIVQNSEAKFTGLSQTARDIEAHTGAKSAESIAKEIAAPILLSARSWTELHQRLAENGISFERKGSGAVLKIGEAAVKTSQADRGCSFSKLVKRLGDFQERGVEAPPVVSEAKPVEAIAADSDVERSWKGYIKNKTDYLEAKAKALAELRERQKKERQELWERQKAEREALWKSENWKGRGKELNQRRSVLAAKHASEKLDMMDAQRQQSKDANSRFLQRFPSFKTWLKEQEDEALFLKYRYPGQMVLTPEKGGPVLSEGPTDIRNFTAVRSSSGVAWCRQPGQADFVDYGRRIVMKSDHDEEAILAAMQLANQKWGAAQINGTDEKYRQLCVAVAIKHGLKISNPDLREAVEEAKKVDRLQAEKDLFARYAKAVGAERFRIVVTDFREDGTRAFVLDRNDGGMEGKTVKEVRDKMWLLAKYARGQKNINVVPMSHDKHHILVDDLTAEKLAEMKADGYSPACVIESSPGNFQAVLSVPSTHNSAEADREAANRLTKRLNERYGDPKLSGSIHAHRLPPFENTKLKHRREDGTYPSTRLTEAAGGLCHKAFEELKDIEKTMREAAKVASTARLARAVTASLQEGANKPDDAYWKHYEDLVRRFTGALDYSQVDGMIGLRMRVTGYQPSQIRDALARNGPDMRRRNMNDEEFAKKYRYRNWQKYATETVEKFVFGPRGEEQYRKAEEYRPYLLKLEGRQTYRRPQSQQQDRGR